MFLHWRTLRLFEIQIRIFGGVIWNASGNDMHLCDFITFYAFAVADWSSHGYCLVYDWKCETFTLFSRVVIQGGVKIYATRISWVCGRHPYFIIRQWTWVASRAGSRLIEWAKGEFNPWDHQGKKYVRTELYDHSFMSVWWHDCFTGSCSWSILLAWAGWQLYFSPTAQPKIRIEHH